MIEKKTENRLNRSTPNWTQDSIETLVVNIEEQGKKTIDPETSLRTLVKVISAKVSHV